MNKKLKIYFTSIGITELVGVISGLITREGIKQFSETVVKPYLTPPAIVFPAAWAILYALMGIGIAMIILSENKDKKKAIILYCIQLFINFCWSILFFGRQMYGFSLLCLFTMWAFILWMIVEFAKLNKTAALLQIPYLLWVSFAAYLNFGVWILN